jgi:hypothetical protein
MYGYVCMDINIAGCYIKFGLIIIVGIEECASAGGGERLVRGQHHLLLAASSLAGPQPKLCGGGRSGRSADPTR